MMDDQMKYSTYSVDGVVFYGAAVAGGMVALSPEFPQWRGLRQVIEAGGLPALQAAAQGCDVTHPDGQFTYDIPILDPEKIICVGVNYPARNEEYKDGQAAPENMSLFIRFARSFVGHNCALVRPKASDQLDYEGEIAAVIGTGGRHIAQAQALDHVATLTLCNEGTLRDWVRHAKFNVTQGKNFDKSGSMGPWIVPFERDDQITDVALTTHVNGALRQSDRTGRMLFPLARQIEYISTFTTLVPGDIIVTGTPTGSGARLDPPVYLRPGDEIVVSADGIGALLNTVMDET
jgi:2-keto-4-pentenoate hydratase/2-oxohepta-3-ene-1,7-dioic acid hydratase in catechol pathway